EAQWLVLPCNDGFVAFVYQDDHWPKVVDLIDDKRLKDPRFTTRAGRLAHREELRPLLEAWTQARTKTKVYHTAQAHGVPVGMVADVADLVASPQYAARGFMTSVDHPSTGPIQYPGVPCTLDGFRPSPRRAPLLGEHNALVYRERLGLTAQDLVGLRERAVI